MKRSFDSRADDRVDKSWVKPKEERGNSLFAAKPGLVEVEDLRRKANTPAALKWTRRRRGTAHPRSAHREGVPVVDDAIDRRVTKAGDGEERHKTPREKGPVEKEKKAKPSVKPPHTPSRSPPKAPKRPPVAKAKQRPTGRYWQGPIRSWKLDPACYYGVNKGVKKREMHYFEDPGGR